MSNRKVLVTGSNGQLGRELKKQLEARGMTFIGYDIPELDITNAEQVHDIIEKEQPDIIVNSAAMTNVDGCELQEEMAEKVNGVAPKYLAEAAARLDIPIVQVSTDYVFDGQGIEENGKKRPYTEDDEINPVSAYGRTKADGEKAVMDATDKYFIVRTAWLYGDGNNFVRTMLKLADKFPQITVVNDQMGSPTSTEDLAAAIIDLMDTDAYGIYHATAEGECAWCDFSEEIFRQAGRDTKVIPVTSEEYAANAGKTVADRPPYSVLENKNLKKLGIGAFRPWKEELTSYLKAEGVID